jgi:hypothetical protein
VAAKWYAEEGCAEAVLKIYIPLVWRSTVLLMPQVIVHETHLTKEYSLAYLIRNTPVQFIILEASKPSVKVSRCPAPLGIYF